MQASCGRPAYTWTIKRHNRLIVGVTTSIDMDVRISVAARNRSVSKAIRRVRPQIDVILDCIRSTRLVDPTWSTVLLTLTDDAAFGAIDETSADEGMIQLLAGFPALDDWSSDNDAGIRAAVVAVLRLTINHCGLTPDDRARLVACLQ